jgi:hypothetical protein
MYLTNFMVDSGIKQDALGSRGFAGVDVSANANVAVTLDGGLAGHHILLWGSADRTLQMRRMRPNSRANVRHD